MADNKKSIVVYADWIDKFEELEDDEAGRLIKHFFRYVNDLNPEAPDRTTKLMFIDIEATLKRDLVKWEKRAERSRENGLKGGRPTTQENPEKPKETQQVILEPRKPDSVNVSGSVSVSDTKSKNDVRAEQFEIFWSFYPKKVAKANCKKKFMKLSDSDVKQISKTIRNYVSYKPFESYIHPHPETYFNQRRWEDEIPEQNQQIGINLNLAAN